MRKSIPLIALTLLLCALAACSAVSPRRGFNRAMIDRNIQITAQHALDTDPQLQGRVHIGTTVYNGVLLMIGEAITADDKARAEADVTGYESVRKVVNLVDVMPPASVGRNALDAALTASVKTALLGVRMPGFDPGRVQVSTAHGNVYLMGLLSHAEAKAATDQVTRLAGVQKVIPVFEYTD